MQYCVRSSKGTQCSQQCLVVLAIAALSDKTLLADPEELGKRYVRVAFDKHAGRGSQYVGWLFLS